MIVRTGHVDSCKVHQCVSPDYDRPDGDEV